ncbi:MAG: translation initiation factor IF-2 [Nitrospirota bacterium]|nr:translation initiation factor IF-2 [Nitrospirota bacterium]
MRVFELARDLEVTSRELLAVLGKMGVSVEDHASRLSDEDVARVRQKLGKAVAAPKPQRKSRSKAASQPPAPPQESPAEPRVRVLVKRRRAGQGAEADVAQEAAAAAHAPETHPSGHADDAPADVHADTPTQVTPEAEPAPPRTQARKGPETRGGGILKKGVGSRQDSPTPPGLTPHLSAEEMQNTPQRQRVVIDLEAHKPRKPARADKVVAPVEEPAAPEAEPAEIAAPRRPTALPSAGDRVRTARTGDIATPHGLTPHLDMSSQPQRERVVIDLPSPAPPATRAKPEKRERKKRETGAATPAATTTPAAEPGRGAADAHKRKWQSFKGKKGKGRGRDDFDEQFSRPERKNFASETSRPRVRAIRIQEGVTVKEFADALGIKVGSVIGELLKMGALATLNDPVDLDAAQLIASDLGVNMEVVLDKTEDELLQVLQDTPEQLKSRPPVVTIMGHVDHGKTSLLDAIRASRVVAGEAGGITQHIGAYLVETSQGQIVFLDTPGHEAFTAMRARGAQVTDIVVLVVAADDGIMPQTAEAIAHAREAGVPIIVAITKVDKPDANPERVTQQMTEYNLVPEEWGGDVQFARVSAHTRQGLDELLAKILLQAEVLELQANPDKPATGHVVEARLDRGRGPVATVLVQAGTLRVGDFFVVGQHTGRVRAMHDDLGIRMDSAGPAIPVEIIGLEGVPSAGDPFNAVTNERSAKDVANTRRASERSRELAREKKMSLDDLFKRMQQQEVMELAVVLRGDVQGSVEAIREGLEKLSTDRVKVKVLHTGVGGITETDVMLASASKAVVIGFSVRPEPKAARLAEQEGVDIRLYSIIYNLLDDVKAAMQGLLAPEYKERTLGRAEVREVFQVPKVGAVAGCSVVDGTILRACAGLRVIRDNVVVHEGKLSQLRRFKEDVKEVRQGYECGISFERFSDIKVGDVIEAYAMDEVAAKM